MDIPSQKGKAALVTGLSGLGYELALTLARADADIVLAGRNAEQGVAAMAAIGSAAPHANIRYEWLDLADLGSVRALGEKMRAAGGPLDILVNNAGVMAPPKRLETKDGFELQLGTNHLGHFLLTCELLPLLRGAKTARVVNVSSIAVQDFNGHIDFDDLQSLRRYRPMRAYAQSKLANLIFGMELQRRSDAGNWGIDSISAHPGATRTDLMTKGAGRWSALGLARRLMWFMFQPVEQGARPLLYAATSPAAKKGEYYGPDGRNEMRGNPAPARIHAEAESVTIGRQLWDVSEQLTGAKWAG